MLFTDWNMEDALKIEREEGREEGWEEGRELARREMIGLFSKYLSAEQMAEALEISVEDVNHYLKESGFKQIHGTFSIN